MQQQGAALEVGERADAGFEVGLDAGAVLEVAAGAEQSAGAGEDDDAGVAVGGGGFEGLAEFAEERSVEGVEALGAVEGDGGDLVFEFVEDGLEHRLGHGGSVSGVAARGRSWGQW